jgi:hypothetical protein
MDHVRVHRSFAFQKLSTLLDPDNRYQRQVGIADALEQSMERGLVGQQAGKQGLIPFQMR